MKLNALRSVVERAVGGVRLRVLAGGLALAFCALSVAACTDPDLPRDNTAMLPENERVSNVPWNKPQGWENNSQLGALANDPRIGGQQQ